MKMVMTGCNRPYFPFHTAVNFKVEPNAAVLLVFGESRAVIGSNRYVIAHNKRRPDVDVFVALVYRRNLGVIRNLLVVVGGVNIHLVVIYAYVAIGITGVNGGLNRGGEDVRGGDIEDEDGGVLEDETGFFGLKNGPNDEDSEKN